MYVCRKCYPFSCNSSVRSSFPMLSIFNHVVNTASASILSSKYRFLPSRSSLAWPLVIRLLVQILSKDICSGFIRLLPDSLRTICRICGSTSRMTVSRECSVPIVGKNLSSTIELYSISSIGSQTSSCERQLTLVDDFIGLPFGVKKIFQGLIDNRFG
jgi:hypothetical protein